MKTFINILKGFFLLLIILTIILVLINVYGFMYKEINQTSFAFLMDYTTYDVVEDNMNPDYKVNDVVVLKRDYGYKADDVIVFNYNDSYRLVKIIDTNGGKYVINDSINSFGEDYKITNDLVIGKVDRNIKGFVGIKNILTSTYSLIILTVFIVLYAFFEVKSNGNR